MIRPSSLTTVRSAIRLASLLGVVAALLLGSSVSLADTHESDQARIEYRQSVMSIIGTNMGAIGDLMKNRIDLPGAIANHASQMAEAAALIAPAFRKNLSEGATDAKPKIWKDWAKFEEAIAKYEAAARDLAAAAASDDPSKVGPAMRLLGKSCGGCHKPFRKPKEESYQNQ